MSGVHTPYWEDRAKRAEAEVRGLEQERVELNVIIGERTAEVERLTEVVRVSTDLHRQLIEDAMETCALCGEDHSEDQCDNEGLVAGTKVIFNKRTMRVIDSSGGRVFKVRADLDGDVVTYHPTFEEVTLGSDP